MLSSGSLSAATLLGSVAYVLPASAHGHLNPAWLQHPGEEHHRQVARRDEEDEGGQHIHEDAMALLRECMKHVTHQAPETCVHKYRIEQKHMKQVGVESPRSSTSSCFGEEGHQPLQQVGSSVNQA